MPMHPRNFVRLLAVVVAVALLAVSSTRSGAEELFAYSPGSHQQGELRYADGVPLLIVQGSPEEIGQQVGTLAGAAAKDLIRYPRRLLKARSADWAWSKLVQLGGLMQPQFPSGQRSELAAIAASAQLRRDEVIAANVMPDAYRMFGCSSLIVDASRSESGGPLLGRNLDFPSLQMLHRYSLVMVVRPHGKHRFASVGFPGLVGCLSGMNDAGLVLAIHEVSASRDGSAPFEREGVPYAMAFRRVLEECKTVEQAAALLRGVKRTTRVNLAVCDRQGGAVFEITPKTLVVRRGEKGMAACTNHFRSRELSVGRGGTRYRKLAACFAVRKVGVDLVARKLHEVHQGEQTLQTMIFEPRTLTLHLAIGGTPSSAQPLKKLELAELLSTEDSSQSQNASNVSP